MPKVVYESTVVGRTMFPIDMLRYDAAYPAREQDSVEIANSFMVRRLGAQVVPQPDGLRRVRLLSSRPLTSARWVSFGWQVDEIATRRF